MGNWEVGEREARLWFAADDVDALRAVARVVPDTGAAHGIRGFDGSPETRAGKRRASQVRMTGATPFEKRRSGNPRGRKKGIHEATPRGSRYPGFLDRQRDFRLSRRRRPLSSNTTLELGVTAAMNGRRFPIRNRVIRGSAATKIAAFRSPV